MRYTSMTMVQRQMANALRQAVETIYAGGTTTSSATPEGYRVGGHALNLVGLLEEHFPDFKPHFKFGRKQVALTGLSENMDASDWAIIDTKVASALERMVRGVLVTYGTDGMKQLAQHLRTKFLDTLQTTGQRLVLTGANKGIEEPETDGWNNLMFGLESAGGSATPDVYVAFDGKLIRGDEVTRLPFVPGGRTTFVSVHDPLYKSSLEQQQARSSDLITKLTKTYDKQPNEASAIIYNVNIVRQDHQELFDLLQTHKEVRAILLNLYHSATANTEKPEQSVTALVAKLRAEKGIVFFGVTDNGEYANLQSDESAIKLKAAGVVPLYDMPKDVAFAKLKLLDADLTPVQRIDAMLTNKVGEIDETRIIKDDIQTLKSLYK